MVCRPGTMGPPDSAGGDSGAGLAELRASDFAPHVGERFPLTGTGPAPLALPVNGLELLEVSERPPVSPGAPRQEPFDLVFRGPGDAILPQATYRLEHPRLGPLDVFLVPIRRDSQGVCYEAVFN